MRLRNLPFSFVAFAIVVGTFACGDGLRQDELDCEEAVSHLDECCPGFQATSRIQCMYDDQGCGNVTEPAIPEDVSSCIRNESCEELATAGGVCDRVTAAQASITPGGPLTSAVCP